MKKYYFNFSIFEGQDAGSKALLDAEKIFEKNGYESVLPKLKTKNRYFRELLTLATTKFHMKKIEPDATIVLNFPPVSWREQKVYSQLLKLKESKRLKIFLLIHDLPELRAMGRDEVITNRFPTSFLNEMDALIVHTEKMKDWLLDEGVKNPQIEVLEIFDYLDDSLNSGGEYGKDIILAGNLSKEKIKFLSALKENGSEISYKLYGPNFDEKMCSFKNVEYRGSFLASEISSVLKGSYGLIWDSEDLIGGIGKYGNYQRYNAPHKCSLYLSAGFPLIVWTGSAMSKFVLANHLGIAIDSLKDIDKVLEFTSENEYGRMKINVQELADKIKKGFFLSTALANLEKNINKS